MLILQNTVVLYVVPYMFSLSLTSAISMVLLLVTEDCTSELVSHEDVSVPLRG